LRLARLDIVGRGPDPSSRAPSELPAAAAPEEKLEAAVPAAVVVPAAPLAPGLGVGMQL